MGIKWRVLGRCCCCPGGSTCCSHVLGDPRVEQRARIPWSFPTHFCRGMDNNELLVPSIIASSHVVVSAAVQSEYIRGSRLRKKLSNARTWCLRWSGECSRFPFPSLLPLPSLLPPFPSIPLSLPSPPVSPPPSFSALLCFTPCAVDFVVGDQQASRSRCLQGHVWSSDR